MKRLMLIDLSYSLHRCLRVPQLWDLNAMVNVDGEVKLVRTGGIYGVFNSLVACMNSYPGYYPVFASDKGLSKRRLELLPNYKHAKDRAEFKAKEESELSEEELEKLRSDNEYREAYVNSKKVIREISKILGIPYIEIDGVEGDDILATLVKRDGLQEAVVITDDKDLIQCVSLNPNAKVLNWRSKTGEVYDSERLESEVGPGDLVDNFVLQKSIVGDGSDNIPQIAYGVGGSKARKLCESIRQLGVSNDDLMNSNFRLISGDIDGGQSFEGRGKNKKLVNDTTPKFEPDWMNKLFEMDNSKAGRNFYRSLVNDNGSQLKVNLQMIDLRLIDDETESVILKEFDKELSDLKDTNPSIFSVAPVFSRYQIKDLAITQLISYMKVVIGGIN